MRLIYRLASVVTIVLSCSSCTMERKKAEARLDMIDSLLQTDPESALKAVKETDNDNLTTSGMKARYALSYSIALDKNRIDICSDSILAPAIRHYSRKGNARERSLTYYYAGRIHENRMEPELAMEWMTMAELHVEKRSYLHALTASCKGRLYNCSCDYRSAAGNFRTAAEIFHETGHYKRSIMNRLREATCLMMAGEYELARTLADDLLLSCTSSDETATLMPALLNIYDVIRPQCTLSLLERYLEDVSCPERIDWLTVSQIYLSNDMAGPALDALKNCSVRDAAYHYRHAQASELSGDFRTAVGSYKAYISQSGTIGNEIIDNDTRFIEERVRHEYMYEKVHLKNTILILSTIAGIMGLALATFVILAFRRQLKIKEQEKEMLKFRMDGLMAEREELSRIHMADENVRKIIAERLAIIDGFVMSETLQDNIFGKEAEEALKEIIKDRDKFTTQTRLIFNQSHPEFIRHLMQKGLSEREIEHCCLYAIGLNGKMVTAFTNLKRHYHVGSDIRKKLGLTGHDTNISIYIRKLLKEIEK